MISENHFKILWEAHLPRNLPHIQLKCQLHYLSKMPIFREFSQSQLRTSIDRDII